MTFFNKTKNPIFQIFYFLLIASLTIGCSESPEPSTLPNPTTSLDQVFSELQGTWGLGEVTFTAEYRIKAKTSGEYFDPFIEFLADSTFLIIDAAENGYRGKYTVNEDQIDLEGFGSLDGYSVENDKLTATIKKTESGESFEIDAVKIDLSVIDEKTKKLMGEWYMVEEIGGSLFLGQEITVHNRKGEPIDEGVIESILIGFMPSGVNYNMFLVNGKLYMNELLYWKWKPSSDEIFIYGEKDQAPNDNSEGILIDELSEEGFTMYEIWEGEDISGFFFERKL
ncbi:hypothetical protein J0A67_09885 [Algoriphagus aestuariicola]|uniref:Lipocalin-like domain-containing protein n=1 Tax=Algoriphagus aestuariicola TaxID=1852016 RepID=A0ABS3BQ61_9BACT|nr:hypothetical protein [Algoriphagus aestuariicola]MBN7801172.1 hypothetical protein [Algoriphagus aestuariicola]